MSRGQKSGLFLISVLLTIAAGIFLTWQWLYSPNSILFDSMQELMENNSTRINESYINTSTPQLVNNHTTSLHPLSNLTTNLSSIDDLNDKIDHLLSKYKQDNYDLLCDFNPNISKILMSTNHKTGTRFLQHVIVDNIFNYWALKCIYHSNKSYKLHVTSNPSSNIYPPNTLMKNGGVRGSDIRRFVNRYKL